MRSEHAFTRAHIWIAACFLIGVMDGPAKAAAGAGLIALIHVFMGIYVSNKEGQPQEQNR